MKRIIFVSGKNAFTKKRTAQINTAFSWLFFVVISFTSLTGMSQNTCGQAEVMDAWFKKNPDKKAAFETLQLNKSTPQNGFKTALGQSAPSYTIPVVFHILHLGGTENISDAQVIDQMAILNRDFQKQNPDTVMIVPSFTNNIANVGFCFKLATIDPDGNCTNGIIRHYTAKTNWDANDLNQFIYTWPPDKYLNIYVVKTINISATAYTFLPGIGIPVNADAIVCLDQVCGSIGTSGVGNSRTLTHEVAHWFSIPHIWGTSNAPGVACGDDGIPDTPLTKGFVSCNTGNVGICTPGVVENVQNYMDYAPCKIMFTNGQAANMIACINSSTNNRDHISTIPNLMATGVYTATPSCATMADFYSTKTSNCVGNTFTFTSLSQFGATTGTLSWSFPGGTPAISSNTSVVVSYATPGAYTVSLTATGANGTDTETKNAYVNVVNGSNGLTLPFAYDFEGAALPTDLTVFNEQADTVMWKHNTTLGANGTGKCIYINNFPDSTNYGNRDYFETPFFNFSNTTGISLSYYYAYAKRYNTQADSFRIQYSLDCGGSWINMIGVPTINAMAINSGGTVTTVFVPTPAQWKQAIIPAVALSALNNKPSVKLRFFFKSDYYVNGSNNIYLDQINITGNVATAIEENAFAINWQLYPNPTSASARLEFLSPEDGDFKITVHDISGKVVEESTLKTRGQEKYSYTLNSANSLAPGLYFIILNYNNKQVVKKMMVQADR